MVVAPKVKLYFWMLIAGLTAFLLIYSVAQGEYGKTHAACASFIVDQVFEGGIFSISYRVISIRLEDREVDVFYDDIGIFENIRCSPEHSELSVPPKAMKEVV